MKFLKIVGIILLIIVLIYLFSGTGPIRSAYSKKMLLNDPIVAQLNAECRYFKPSRFLATSNPHLSCQTLQRFGEQDQVVEIERLEKILVSHGWKLTEKYHPRNITYRKDELKFTAQPYYWEPGITKDQNPKLLIYFAHMSLADYGN